MLPLKRILLFENAPGLRRDRPIISTHATNPGPGTLRKSILDNGPSLDNETDTNTVDEVKTSSRANQRRERRQRRDKSPPRARMVNNGEYGFEWGQIEPMTEWGNEIPQSPAPNRGGGLWGRQMEDIDSESISSRTAPETNGVSADGEVSESQGSRWRPSEAAGGGGGREGVFEPFADVLSGTRERAKQRDEGRWGRRPNDESNTRSSGDEQFDGPNKPDEQRESEPVSAQIDPLSDIVLLSRRDTERVLPVLPKGKQADYYQPKTLQERIVMLLGSLGGAVLFSKATALAAPTLLYPLWSPWFRAGVRNLELYAKQFKVVGLWRAQVIDVEVKGIDWMNYAMGGINGGGVNGAMGGRRFVNGVPFDQPFVKLVVGDGWEGGARVELEFPFQPRSEMIRPGDQAELLVLCQDEAFVSFKVVRELYLPQSALWLADYPFVDRGSFLDISLGIERMRQEEMERQNRASVDYDDADIAQPWTGVASYEESQ